MAWQWSKEFKMQFALGTRLLPAWANLILILLASNLVTSSASAVCFTWNSPPALTLAQSNGFQVSIKNIQPNGIYINGDAYYRDNTGGTTHGKVTGTMGRSQLQMEIKWDGGGDSIYTINFDESGTITGGNAFEAGNPGKTFSVSSVDKFTCAEHPDTTTNPPPTNPVDAALNQFCQDFAVRQDARVAEATRLNCAFLSGSGGWNQTPEQHVKSCLSFGAQAAATIPFSERGLDEEINNCKQDPSFKGGIATIVKDVTLYDTYKDANRDLCYLHPNDTALIRPKAVGAPAPWMHLIGKSGDCKGKDGYLFNQGEARAN